MVQEYGGTYLILGAECEEGTSKCILIFPCRLQLRKRIDEEKLLPRSPEVPKSRWKCNQVLLKENSRMGHFSRGFLDQAGICTYSIQFNLLCH